LIYPLRQTHQLILQQTFILPEPLDLPANWEQPSMWQAAIPADHRDFSRPRESFWHTTVPADLNQADDVSDDNIKAVQQFLSQSPLGISAYTGSIDGKMNPLVQICLSNLQMKAILTFPNENWELFNAFGINFLGIQKLMKLMQNQNAGDSTTKSFQRLCGLPESGIIDDKLISSLKSFENIISQRINDPSVSGMIWNDSSKTFATSPEDVAEALKLIKK
jgi:hypothetical protein